MHLNEPITELAYSQAQDEPEASSDSEAQVLPPPPPPAERPEKEHAVRHARSSKSGLVEIGVIYGNVGTTSFNILLTGEIEKLEYVQTEHEHHGWILGQIIEIERVTDFTAAKAVEAVKGASLDIEEKEIARVSLIGYRDERNLLQSPRTPLRAGAAVYRATDDLIRQVVGLKEGSPTGAYIGLLSGHDIRVELDINKMVQKHVSILAMTGAGKSYCSGDLIEEFMKHDVTTVIIDPHGEYHTLGEKGRVEKTARDFGVHPRGYADRVIEFAANTAINKDAKPLRFTLSALDAREILSLTNIKNVRSYLTMLRRTLDVLREAKGDFTLKDVIDSLLATEDPQVNTLVSELEYLQESEIFADKGTRIDELVRKGKTTVINLKGAPPDIQELIVNRLCTSLFELRKSDKIPPLMLVCEEAHNFAPQQGKACSTKIMRTIASEGRKFGLGLTIISQRPAKVDKNVLSQCNTQIILKVLNPNDLKAISASIEGLTEAMEEEIQRLPIGTALVTGGGTAMPLFVDIRPRETKHGGESIEIVPSKRM
ncbi:MAG: ATP-binding protein [Thermoplasmata archaeon]